MDAKGYAEGRHGSPDRWLRPMTTPHSGFNTHISTAVTPTSSLNTRIPTSTALSSVSKTTNPTTEQQVITPQGHHDSSGAIEGGVSVAVLAAAVILAISIFFIKKRRRKPSNPTPEHLDATHASLPQHRSSNDYGEMDLAAQSQLSDDADTREHLNERPLPPTPTPTPLTQTLPQNGTINHHNASTSSNTYENQQTINDHAIGQLYAVPKKRLSGEMELTDNELYSSMAHAKK